MFLYTIALEGPAIGQEVTEWVLQSASPITPSAEEYISSTPNIGVKKSKSNSLKRNQIEIESRGKPQSSHHYMFI